MKRRTLLQTAAAAAAFGVFAKAGAARADAPKELRVGYQKAGPLLIVKAQNLLEKRFEAQGIAVRWVEFQFGPPLLEALNTGAIDFGYTGDAPPVFAQAARANFNYVATSPSRGDTQAILVPADSPLKTPADLRGKKIAVARASSAHNLLISVLDEAGIPWSEIEPVYLAPADAAAAFSRGAVAAWSIWDPYYAIAEQTKNARPLPISRAASVQNTFYLANKSYLEKHPDVISATNEELAKAVAWAKDNLDAVSDLYSSASGVDIAPTKRSVARTAFSYEPLNDTVLAQQQAVADRFHRLGLTPKPVAVRDVVWVWRRGV